VISTFPNEWYVSATDDGDPIPGLQPLARYFLNAATSIDQATATMGELKKKETRYGGIEYNKGRKKENLDVR
jgi:hypothetical protein